MRFEIISTSEELLTLSYCEFESYLLFARG